MRFGLLSNLFCFLSLFLVNPSIAKELNQVQYDARLCSAQLLVLNGDLKRLQLSETKPHHKTGLKYRVSGALGTLEWLCRQNSHSNFSINQKKIYNIRLAFEDEDWQKAIENLETLISAMPIKIENFKFKYLSKKTHKTSISIYEHYCQTCHNQPSDKSETPAYSLFEMAKRMSREELLARMIVGIHGTPKIGLRNPLTDDDITGLITYITKTKKAKHQKH